MWHGASGLGVGGAGGGWSRRRVLAGVTAAAAAGLAGPAGAAGLAVALPQAAGFAHLPLHVARVLDFYGAMGLAVQWVPVASDRHAAKALAAGSVGAAAMDFSQVLQLRAQGVPVVAIALQSRCPLQVLGVHPHVRGEGRFAALRGRRVGLVGTGAAQLLAARVLQLGGLGSGDVAVQVLPSAEEVVDGFRAVALDGFCLDDAQVAALEQRAEVRLLADTRTVRGTLEVHGAPVPGAVLAVSQAMARLQPEVCRQLARGVVLALRWLQTAGPTDWVRKLPEALLGPDPGLFLMALEKARDGVSLDGVLSAEAASAALLALLRSDARALGLQTVLAETFRNDFVEQARRGSRA